MKFLRKYIRNILREEYQSHSREPKPGDPVVNVNPGCDHFKSRGTVLVVKNLPKGAGKTAKYRCTNSGPKWSEGDVLEKTMDQLSPCENSKVRDYVREVLETELTSRKQILPQDEWVLLSPGDPRRDEVKEDLYSMVCDTYAPIGGHFKVCKPQDLERYSYWLVKDIDEDPGVDVAIMGKPDIGGIKMGAAANDGSPEAAAEYKNKSAELRAGGEIAGVGNWWGEVSDKPAYAMIRRGAKAVEDESKVRQLLDGDDITWHGPHPDPEAPGVFKSVNGWYTKSFGAKKSTKIILGNPL